MFDHEVLKELETMHIFRSFFFRNQIFLKVQVIYKFVCDERGNLDKWVLTQWHHGARAVQGTRIPIKRPFGRYSTFYPHQKT